MTVQPQPDQEILQNGLPASWPILEKAVLKANPVLVGGPPRSGTTLAVNLLDNHPEVFVFPFEHRTLESFYLNPSTDFHQEFITSRSSGQQSIPFSNELLFDYSQKIEREYGFPYSLPLDAKAARRAYNWFGQRHTLEKLENILRCLAFSLTCAQSKPRSTTPKWLVFKQPFFTELLASRAFQDCPTMKFIHVTRDPKERYASAKLRRVFPKKDEFPRRLTHINRLAITEGHFAVHGSSEKLRHQNLREIGQKTYLQIDYQTLAKNRGAFASTISEWLSIESNNCLLTPTIFGTERPKSSSKLKLDPLDTSTYNAITSRCERTVHAHLIRQSSPGNRAFRSRIIPALASLCPPKHLALRGYPFQLIMSARILANRDEGSLDFSHTIRKAQLDTIQVSGST